MAAAQNPWLSLLLNQNNQNASVDPSLNTEEPLTSQYISELALPKEPDQGPMASFMPSVPQANTPQATLNQDSISPVEEPASPAGQAAAKNIAAMKAYLASIDPKNLPGRADQLDTINRLKAYRNMAPIEQTGMDLKPFLAYSDSINPGGKLAANYTAPETSTSKIADINKINETISSLSGKMNTEDLATLRDKLMGNIALTRFGQDKQDAKQALQQQKNGIALFKDMEQTKGRGAVKNAWDATRQLDNLDSLLNEYPDTNKLNSYQIDLLTKELAKVAGGGAATEAGQKDLRPSSLMSSFKNALSKVTNEPTGSNLGAFIDVYKPYAQSLRDNAYKAIGEAAQAHQAQYKGQVPDPVMQSYEQQYAPYLDAIKARQAKTASANASGSTKTQAPTPNSPPVAGAIRVQNKKTGAFGWKLPDGTIQGE